MSVESDVQALAQQVETLQRTVRRITGGDTSNVGLFDELPNSAVRIYVGTTEGVANDNGWYTLEMKDNRTKRIPIPQKCLVGRIVQFEGVKIPAKDRYPEKKKIDITIEADKTYIVRSGSDTAFMRGVISSMASAPTETLTGRIALSVKLGDNEKVVFGSFHNADTGSYVKGETRLETHEQVVAALSKLCKVAGIPFVLRTDTHGGGE